MKIDINLKTLGIASTVIVALVTNVFVLGQFYNSQQVHMNKMVELQVKVDNYLDVKKDILELNYKIKSLKLLVDPEYNKMCSKNMNDIRCK